ncbi:hypothetical protein LCGC14_1767740 [marine sediment metagenome]|uniref:Uncharacterized protein n=1 Tax=marine sediment metagenome TaxID=412755 RepID=A0A0F9JE03_9ZZZZ
MAKTIKVWVNPGSTVSFATGATMNPLDLPYDGNRAWKIDFVALHLQRKGWKFFPFQGGAVGWVAVEPR